MSRIRYRSLCRGIVLLLSLGSAITPSARTPESDLDLHIAYRINAHGDEFMSLARTADGRRLIVGTEKGELLVWGIAERRLLKTLVQGSPVHEVAALSDPCCVLAVGGFHSGARGSGVARKWNLDDGTFLDLKSAGNRTLTTLAVDRKNDKAIAANADGRLTAWDTRKAEPIGSLDLNQKVVGLALVNGTLYLTTLNPEDVSKMDEDSGYTPDNSIISMPLSQLENRTRTTFARTVGRFWAYLNVSPNNERMIARYTEQSKHYLALFDLKTGTEITHFPGRTARWANDQSLVLFDEEVPTELVQINADGTLARSKLLTGAKFHESGTPAGAHGQIVSDDLATAWEVFQMGAMLGQCDLRTKHCESLYEVPGLAYTMDVLEREGDQGLVATGGDDRYVRVWRRSDFSLLAEFHTEPGVPQGVALMDDGRHVVFSSSGKDSPTEITIAGLTSKTAQTLFTVPEPFVKVAHAAGGFIYHREGRLFLFNASASQNEREFKIDSKLEAFATSANGEWLTVADDKGNLYLFEVRTGRRMALSSEKIEDLTMLAVANDGRYAYTTEWKAALRRWDTRQNTLEEIGSIRGQAHALQVSPDGRRVIVGGNHRDLAVFNSSTGKQLTALETEASDFYVTNAWLSGNQIIFTTDTGVLFAGTLK